MYRIKLHSGEESQFSSYEELCFGIVSGIIGPDDEIYHARAAKWLPIQTHPDYKRAANQAPPPSPAMSSPASAPPATGIPSHEPDEEAAGQDLMTLLDLEELTAFDPGKVQESAPLEEAAPEAETADLEELEPEQPGTNGHAQTESLTNDDGEEASLVQVPSAEPSARESLADEDSRDDLDISKETELDDGQETPVAELELPEDEVATLLEDDEADESDSTRDVDYVAEEDRDDEPMMGSPIADQDSMEEDAAADDQVAVADELSEPMSDVADGAKDIDYIAAEDDDDVPAVESVTADTTEEDEADLVEPAGDEDEHHADTPVTADISVEEESVEDADGLEEDEPVEELPVEAAIDTDDDTDEAVAEVASGEILEDEEDEERETEMAGDEDGDHQDALLGGPVVELDTAAKDEISNTRVAARLEEEPDFTADTADAIAGFQPSEDDDPFRDTFSPMAELDSPRRFPVLPVAIAAGVVIMGALGWVIMGASGANEPATVPEPPPVESASTAPTTGPDLTQQSLAAEDPSEDVQRRYQEAYDRARSRLDADLRRAGYSAVFAPANFASAESMTKARAAIAGAGLAVTAYAGREQAIMEELPDADPVARESRAHRELSEDLLAVSRRIYGLLLDNPESFAIRSGEMVITDSAVESEYSRLRSEIDRLMGLAATAVDEEAATVSRISAGIGATRPPPLVELAPPPALPSDL